MNDFISRFNQDLQPAGNAKRRTQSYVPAVSKLQRSHNKPLEDSRRVLRDRSNSDGKVRSWSFMLEERRAVEGAL